jgi:hypothetical protein
MRRFRRQNCQAYFDLNQRINFLWTLQRRRDSFFGMCRGAIETENWERIAGVIGRVLRLERQG